MNNKTMLYKTPFIVGTIFLIASLFLIVCGFIAADVQNNSDWYALVVFGSVFLITAVVILLIYGSLEQKFKNAFKNPLLCYTLTEQQFEKGVSENIKNIDQNNKFLLNIMLFFCTLSIVISPFLLEDGYIISIISACLAFFLIIAKIIITSFRIRKIKKGVRLVMLSENSVYSEGEFHCFNTKATKLNNVILKESNEDYIAGYIEISYTAAALPACNYYTVTLPVPSELMGQAKKAVEILISSNK